MTLSGLTLPGLAVLALLTVLAVAIAGIHSLQLIAKPLDAVKRRFGILRLSAAHRLLCFAHLRTELLQALSNLRLGGIGVGIDAAVQPIRASLNES